MVLFLGKAHVSLVEGWVRIGAESCQEGQGFTELLWEMDRKSYKGLLRSET